MHVDSKQKLLIYHGMQSHFREMDTSHTYVVLCVAQKKKQPTLESATEINNLNFAWKWMNSRLWDADLIAVCLT